MKGHWKINLQLGLLPDVTTGLDVNLVFGIQRMEAMEVNHPWTRSYIAWDYCYFTNISFKGIKKNFVVEDCRYFHSKSDGLGGTKLA
jgi:hypothetical protein